MKRCFVLILAALLIVCCISKAENPRIKVTKLRCEYRADPLGIDIQNPRLSWILESNVRSQRQTSYQVIVASKQQNLHKGYGDLWDSGKVNSNESLHVVYKGKALKSEVRCYWKVRIWDKDGKVSKWSKAAWWEMALLNSNDWNGRWVLNTDHASHFNLTTFLQWKDHKLTDRTKTRIMLQGLTEKNPEELVDLAKSWLQAPKARILAGEFKNIGYDQTERAYVIQANNNGRPSLLHLELNAGQETPLVNPALIIKQWGRTPAEVYINDKPVPTGQLCRIGHASTLEGVNLVIWLKLESTRPVQLSIKPYD